ncbi:hypothetical protein BO94DRAFT_523695 [Aspergillus sclerotioniger CBS 115572]|uniref:Aminoglycoside phosphotransferase domain-containing protein n=1 Tax=Aspergillus sclerotioniger CBS 115572 TaxID=1450535 RepID=A0A317VVQ5_9EURO|nr:hypothetical protein BO94DRAFT_523695 [Aspergillus sclerotioniger CBS 115572]PWY75980.1 hypothetical protein BO94DRAFT_523695 [Aspergillus sclerotioniger CBS 115572]
MAPSPNKHDPSRVARILLSQHSLELISCSILQTLWAGYGHICAITARATTTEAETHLSTLCGVESQGVGTIYPLILKLIAPPRGTTGREEDEGHLRKMFSYEVEQVFYSEVVPRLGDQVAVAACLASTRGMAESEEDFRGLMATIMVDLRPRFPVAGGRRSALTPTQVHGALDWLAGFHRCSWNLLPETLDAYVLPPLQESKRRELGKDGGTGLWLNGGYTYLETRRKEYASLAQDVDSEWSDALCRVLDGDLVSVAEMVALVLSPCGRPMESYIHGDVKSENLFTNTQGNKVAFFDFQYVGLGLGVCDLAKLFTCSVPLEMLVDDEDPLPEQLTMQEGERRLLEWYRTSLLEREEPDRYGWDMFKRHWEVALVDWCRFQASWGFWGNTEWLEARVRSILNDREWRNWLKSDISSR